MPKTNFTRKQRELLAKLLVAHRIFNEVWTVNNIAKLTGLSRQQIRNYVEKNKQK